MINKYIQNNLISKQFKKKENSNDFKHRLKN